MTLNDMCIGRALALEGLSEQISSLSFETKPNYDKMKCIFNDLRKGALPPQKESKFDPPQLCLSPRQFSL